MFIQYFESIREQLGQIVLVSPDVGNVKMANRYASWLGGDLAIIEKRRLSGTEVISSNIIGDVKGKTVLMCDDMITTAGDHLWSGQAGHGARGQGRDCGGHAPGAGRLGPWSGLPSLPSAESW